MLTLTRTVILPNGQQGTITATAVWAPRAASWEVTFTGRYSAHAILVEGEAPFADTRFQAHWAGYLDGCTTHDEAGVLLDWRERWAEERAQAYTETVRECRQHGARVVQSRGREWVPAAEGCAIDVVYGAKITHKDLRAAIERADAIGADVLELREGFNGAESVRAMIDGDYEPWVGSASLIVWERAKKA